MLRTDSRFEWFSSIGMAIAEECKDMPIVSISNIYADVHGGSVGVVVAGNDGCEMCNMSVFTDVELQAFVKDGITIRQLQGIRSGRLLANKLKEKVMKNVSIVRCNNCHDLTIHVGWFNFACKICGCIQAYAYNNKEQFIELCDNGYMTYSENEMLDCIWAHHHSADCCVPYINPVKCYDIGEYELYCKYIFLQAKWYSIEESCSMNWDVDGDAYTNPIVMNKDNWMWYYFDETWCHVCGPFADKVGAKESLRKYCIQLEYGGELCGDDPDGSIAERDCQYTDMRMDDACHHDVVGLGSELMIDMCDCGDCPECLAEITGNYPDSSDCDINEPFNDGDVMLKEPCKSCSCKDTTSCTTSGYVCLAGGIVEDGVCLDYVFKASNGAVTEFRCTAEGMAYEWLKDPLNKDMRGGFTEEVIRQLMFELRSYKDLALKYRKMFKDEENKYEPPF